MKHYLKNRNFFLIILLFAIPRLHLHSQGFTEIAANLGIQFGYSSGEYGGGVSFADFNGDGMDDLTFATGNGQSIRFFQNNGNGFTELNLLPGNNSEVKQVLWIDYNNDGAMDLYVTAHSGNKLFKNLGDLQLADITPGCGFTDPPNSQSFCSSWLDYNRDGLPDFCVSFRIAHLVGAIKLYRNLGNDQFEDVTVSSGLGGLGNSVLSMATLDVNNDGWEDIFVGQDYDAGCLLLKNKGDGTFSNISVSSNSNILNDAMSVTIGDYDGNGFIDVYLTNTPGGNTLLRNNGDETFTDRAFEEGVDMNQFSWGALFVDGENDMDLDLHVNATNASRMFENNDDLLSFENVTGNWGFGGYDQYCVGLAGGDYNNDGYVDLAKNNSYGSVNTFWENTFSENNYLAIDLVGTISNVNAIGSLIEIYTDSIKQIRHVGCGENFSSQNSYTQYFGLGNISSVDSMIIHWPNGLMNVHTDLSTNQKLTFTEYQQIFGCTDPMACNFNPDATDNDSSCTFPVEFYDCSENCLNDDDGDGICNELEILGCTDTTACNYEPLATESNGICNYPPEYYNCLGNCISDIDSDGICDELEIGGCQDPAACNFNPGATESLDICFYPPQGILMGPATSATGNTDLFSIDVPDSINVEWIVTGGNELIATPVDQQVEVFWYTSGLHTISAIPSFEMNCTGDTLSMSVNVIATGILDETPYNSILFPNPVKSGAPFQIAPTVPHRSDLYIADESGRIVHQQTINSDQSHVSAPVLAPGVYQVVVERQTKTLIFSILIID